MPIYEYRCEQCGHRFERWQKMSDPDPDQCPECKAQKVERLISAVGFRLKGSGWYETDFKQKNRHNIAGDKGDKGDKGDSSGKSASSSERGEKSEKSLSEKSAEKKKPAKDKASDSAA